METLVELTRGGLVESRHRGVIAIVDGDGVIRASLGDVEQVVFMRSSAKPLQIVPLIETGAADHYGFTQKELAVMMASHNGEPMHVDAVRSILGKIGLDEGALQCGVHPPMHEPTARELWRKGEEPSAVHNNCSGKHSGMLALAVHRGYPLDDYTSLDHPVQVQIRATVANFVGLRPDRIEVAVDGCGVPVFGCPLWRAAHAYAGLVDPTGFSHRRSEACRRAVAAMQAHPEMVGGTGQFTTDLMRVGQHRLVCKTGAAGYFAVGVLPTDDTPALGITVKIEDGDPTGRARGPVVLHLLHEMGVLQETDLEQLKDHWPSAICNHRGDEVGEVRIAFDI